MRDEKIDFLRFLGLSMIILAHVDPPSLIFEARNFDIPLMVTVAGLSFQASFKGQKYLTYWKGRVKRLIFPVWLFLSGYFLIIYLTGSHLVSLDSNTILSSYLLLKGIGYVWIIRVFFLIATVAPFIYSYSQKQSSNYRYLATLAVVYAFYELFLAVYKPLNQSALTFIFESTILYLIPYGIVFSIGLRLPKLTRNQLITVSLITLSVFIAWSYAHWITFGRLSSLVAFKYPPHSYYLPYGIFASSLAWIASERVTSYLRRVKILPFVLFVGQNSMWIYLWHIPFVETINLPFQLKYLIVFLAAVSIVYLQIKLVKHYVIPHVRSSRLKNNLRLLLTG